jgi:hypothetical protein
MTFEQEELAKIEEELDGARRDLHETLSAVNAKMEREVERVEETFSPEEMLRNNIVGASCIAALAGFLIGSSKYKGIVGPVVLAAVGYGIWSGLTEIQSDEEDGAQSDHS